MPTIHFQLEALGYLCTSCLLCAA